MGILSKKGILSESSFNRLLSWIKNYEIAFITAFRSIKENILHDDLTKEDSKKIGDVYSKSENRELGASLLRMGYGITKISGANIANFGNPNSGIADEESFLVVNIMIIISMIICLNYRNTTIKIVFAINPKEKKWHII